MVTRHNAVSIGLPAFLAPRMARGAVAANLATAAVQTGGLFPMGLAGCGIPRPGVHECAAVLLGPHMRVLPRIAGRVKFGYWSDQGGIPSPRLIFVM